jgi:spore coat assembly protein SafA
LETYDIKEDTKQGFDVVVTVKLKQYRDFGTKTYDVVSENTITVKDTRPAESSPKPTTTNIVHVVQKGDTLWGIAKRYDVTLSALVAANPQIKNPNLIYPGNQVNIP